MILKNTKINYKRKRIRSIVVKVKSKGVCITKGDNLKTGVIFQDGSHQFFTQKERMVHLTNVNIALVLANYKYNGIPDMQEDFNRGIFDEAWESETN